MNKGNCNPTKLIFFCLFCFLLFRMRRKSETGHRAKRKREKSKERTILPLQPGRPHGTLATPPLLYSAEYLFYMLEKCLLLHTSRFCRAPLFSFFFFAILNFFFLFFLAVSPPVAACAVVFLGRSCYVAPFCVALYTVLYV